MRMFSLSLLLTASLVWAAQAPAKLVVVATTADVASLAREVGGDLVEITTLARPSEDPHFVDPKPSFIVKLNRAEVLIEGGAELEAGWLPPLLQGARNAKINPGAPGHIRANQGVEMLEVPTVLDRSKGDIHTGGNPHFLVDPVNARIAAGNIAEGFARVDPASAEVYRRNYERFAKELDARLEKWTRQLAPCRGECLVSYHNSWPYFARRFGFKVDLFLEPKPGIPPTPTHLAEVIVKMRQQHAHAIFLDVYLDRRTAETVAARTGATIVPVTQFPGGIKGTEGGYLDLMDYLVEAAAKAFASHR